MDGQKLGVGRLLSAHPFFGTYTTGDSQEHSLPFSETMKCATRPSLGDCSSVGVGGARNTGSQLQVLLLGRSVGFMIL